jgi:hypothetical protein
MKIIIQSEQELLAYADSQPVEQIVVNGLNLFSVNDDNYLAVSNLNTTNLVIGNSVIELPYLPVYDVLTLNNCYINNMDGNGAAYPRKLVLDNCIFSDIRKNMHRRNFIGMEELVLDNISLEDTFVLLHNIIDSNATQLTVTVFVSYADDDLRKCVRTLTNMGVTVTISEQLKEQYQYAYKYYPGLANYTKRYNEILNQEMRKNTLSEVGYILYEYMKRAGKYCQKHLDVTDKILSTYRGINAEYAVNLQVGDVITNNVFTSTSLKKRVAHNFSRAQGKVLIYNFYPSQVQIIPILDSLMSYYDNEFEVVLCPYYNWRVKEVLGNEIYLVNIPGMTIENFTINAQIDAQAIRKYIKSNKYFENEFMSRGMLKAYQESSVMSDNTFQYNEERGLALIEYFSKPDLYSDFSEGNKYDHATNIIYDEDNLLNFIIAIHLISETMLPSKFESLQNNLFFLKDLMGLIKSDQLVLDSKTVTTYLTEKVKSNVRQVTITECYFSPTDKLDFKFDSIETLLFHNCIVDLEQVSEGYSVEVIVE